MVRAIGADIEAISKAVLVNTLTVAVTVDSAVVEMESASANATNTLNRRAGIIGGDEAIVRAVLKSHWEKRLWMSASLTLVDRDWGRGSCWTFDTEVPVDKFFAQRSIAIAQFRGE